MNQPDTAKTGDRVVALYPLHRAVALGLNGLLTIANYVTGAPWWAVWPLLVTGFALGLHYLVYKIRTTDDEWVQQRVDDLHDRSYDRGHIEVIQDSDDKGRRP